jgi:uncharacterized protein DUF2785
MVILAVCQCAQAEPKCPPDGYTRARLEALKGNRFEIADDVARNALAVSLVGCLSSPDPTLRDGIAFEALSHFLRKGELGDATMLSLERALLAWLSGADEPGFRRPFAALALSEVARADRIKSFLPQDARAILLEAAIAYFRSVTDYRGFNEREGWRHGVAHGADLLLQLSLNPAFGRREIDRILAALETQLAPDGQFYVYGEPARMARLVVAIASRGLVSEDDWTKWLERASAPAPFSSWVDAYSSQRGLARVHDINAFVSRLYIVARLTSDKNIAALLPGSEKAVRALMVE